MANNENTPKKGLKEFLSQLPNHIKIMLIISIFFLVFGFSLNASKDLEEHKFTVYTLSSAELSGDTYTSKTTFDDSDMWETEPYSESNNTSVITTAETVTETASMVSFPLDINTATADELVQIDGIGTVTAEKIIDYRNKYGYFYDYTELLNIDGIGEKKLVNLMEYIYISEEFLDVSTTASIVETTVTSVPITETKVPETVTVTIEISETTEVTEASKVIETTKKKEKSETSETETEEFLLVIEELETDDESEEETEDEFKYESEDEEITTVTTERPVNFPIELNTATVEELLYIDGIGEYTAYKIIEYAKMYGFYSVDDLLNIDGIGTVKLAQISPYVYVNSSMLPPKPENVTQITEEVTNGYTETVTEHITEASIPIVNINTCSKYELMQLPGIDESLATKIIEFRETIGGYLKIEELSLVDGMTNDKLSAIWNYICI